MNYNSLMNKPTINYRELIGDNTVTEVGGITEEQFNTLLNTDLSSYYTKAQIDDLFSRSFVYREKSGSIVTFDCPTNTNGIAEVTSEIVAVQAGTGDPSPTNVRPITGWSAVNVVVSPTTDAADGTTYTTTLKDGQGNPLTCYGGQLENVNGVQSLTNTRVEVIYDGSSDENWAVQGTAGFYIDVPTKKVGMGNYMASNYKATNSSGWDVSTPVGCFSGHPTLHRLYFRYPYDNFPADLTEWKTWLSNNPIQIVYELATPQTIPQDNLAIASEDGTNNLWADSGDVLSGEYLEAL